jgi:outer membrane biosynthesis protein TonB
VPDSFRPAFEAYSLPLPPRRQGRAAALSFVAHVTIAVLVLWRGAELFQSGGRGRPAVSWFALPAAPAVEEQQLQAPPAVTVPTVAVPAPEVAKIDIPLTPTPQMVAPPTAPVGTGDGTTGGPGQGPGSGGGRGTGTGTGVGADSGSGSGGNASDIFPASPRWAVLPPRGAPREARGRRYEVRFWVTAEGRVTRVEVTPPIKDGDYAREFRERMMGYLFNPATTRDGRRIDYIASATVIP